MPRREEPRSLATLDAARPLRHAKIPVASMSRSPASPALPRLAHSREECLAEFKREGFTDMTTYRRWRYWLHSLEEGDADVSASDWVKLPIGGWAEKADAERELLRLQLEAAHAAANGIPAPEKPASPDAPTDASDDDLKALLATAGYELE